MNRRVEVEFWYDDPLQDLPDEPQLCPDDLEETVTRVYDPAWGSIPNIEFENGQLIIPPGYAENLHRALADIADRTNARLRFIGYTKNERTRPPHRVRVQRRHRSFRGAGSSRHGHRS